jgi:hypothetical protein
MRRNALSGFRGRQRYLMVSATFAVVLPSLFVHVQFSLLSPGKWKHNSATYLIRSAGGGGSHPGVIRQFGYLVANNYELA